MSPAQISQVNAAGSNAPLLKCLHIIGREGVPITKSSIEGVLVSLLAKHALLLTLHVKTVLTFPDLPSLQHLVLDVGTFPSKWMDEQNNAALFPAISMLQGLKTLYLQSSQWNAIFEPTDLAECVHLRHVALQGVCLEGALALPAGCTLHVRDIPGPLCGVTHTTFDQITGMTLRHSSGWELVRMYHGMEYRYRRMRRKDPILSNLMRLRVTLNREDLHGSFWRPDEEEKLQLTFDPSTTTRLEVLELDVPCDLDISIDPSIPVKSLVVITAGALHLGQPLWRQTPEAPLREMYLQSGSAFLPLYEAVLEGTHARESWAGLLQSHVRQEQDRWSACMPASFAPCDLQECCCSACPECLLRAGVPVLCDQAWTRDGFEEHLRQCCIEEP